MLKVQNNSMGCYNSKFKFRINIWKGCGHFYGCGRDDTKQTNDYFEKMDKGILQLPRNKLRRN